MMSQKMSLIIVAMFVTIAGVSAVPPSTLPNGQTAYAVDPQFPTYPFVEGRCWDGVQSLGTYYSNYGFEVKYAYSSGKNGDPGHAWLLVDNEPIDYYNGRVDNDSRSYWMNPEQTYDSIDEFRQHVIDSTSVRIPVTPGEKA